MEGKIANTDEFQMEENGTPMLPAGLREEGNLYVLPDGRYLPCGATGPKMAAHSFMSRSSSAPSGKCLPNSRKTRDMITSWIDAAQNKRQNHQ